MSGPKDVSVRMPAVSGRFYPRDAVQCDAAAQGYLRDARARLLDDGTSSWIGGIVPHAGWVCSAAIAAQTLVALAGARPSVDVVVIFGAVHTGIRSNVASFDSHPAWRLPGTDCQIAQEVEQALLTDSGAFVVDDRFHVREHAVEVELPLVEAAWRGVRVLPIETPPDARVEEIGAITARRLIAMGLQPVYLASSDLTHYGPDYGFVPAGVGAQALAWAKDNDRRMLERVINGQVSQIVPEARAHANACGSGAIAAMLAACREHGASRGKLLAHANSVETLADVAPQTGDNAVGYAAVVIG